MVSLLDDDERERVVRFGAELEIENAVENGRLRVSGGQCVFLSDQGLCRIHATYGFEQKPHLCRQFPVVALRAEDGVRIGVDPACFHSWTNWESGPPVEVDRLVVGRVERSDSDSELERRLLHFCESGSATVSGLVHWVCGVRPVEGALLPPGFEARLHAHLKSIAFADFWTADGCSPTVRSALEGLVASVLEPSQVPEFSLGAGEEEWAIESLRRTLYLRLSGTSINVGGAVLLYLIGVVVIAWSGRKEEAFAHALAGWVRAMRFPHFWTPILPDSQTMARLTTGA
jgi:hypothetical protein